jgi:protein SCO1/2
MVLTPTGKLSRYFFDIHFPPRDLRLGLVEASANQIGSPVDQILLFCFHYDPAEGKYGPAVMRILRLLGAVTVLAIATFFLMQWRRGRRAARKALTAG